MMKRIYICLLMLMVLSSAAFAQKKGSPEYNAQLRTTIIAMDSVLRNETLRKNIPPDVIKKFANEQCENFKNDPDLMSAIADLFLTAYGNEIFANERYSELKQMHPTYINAYLNEANLFHSRAWKDAPAFDSNFLLKAKTQIDSAKILFPTETEPYMKWARMQAPFRRHFRLSGYENLTVDNELEELQKKFPTYPCYLEMAKYYDEVLSKKKGISRDDMISYIVYAGEFYEKADINTLKQNEIVDYADICYQINDEEHLNKGLEVLDYGIRKYPEYAYNYRFKMWIEGKLSQWENLVATGNIFMQKSDSLPKLNDDYMWLGIANLRMKHYEDAISYFKMQQELGIKDSMQQVACYRNLLDCYNGQSDLHHAVETFEKLKSFKEKKGMDMTVFDYLKLETAYRYQTIDTTIVAEKRIEFFKKLISICEIEGKLSPADIGSFYNNRFNYTFQLIGVEFGEQDIKRPEVLQAAKDLVDVVTNLQASQSEAEKDVNDTYYLCAGYRAMMVHYFYTDNGQEAYKLAEHILYDMPEAIELQGLHSSYANYYISYKSAAQQIYDTLRSKFGRKRK